MITCLEYAKFAQVRSIEGLARCENPETAMTLMREGKPVIFFCGHQSNWEVLFLEGTSRMPGVAIGRPIANRFLYNWLLKVRQKFGGKIIAPHNAVREGLRALKAGSFLGIVGDQGMPDSGFSSLFLGRRAWTSPLPAILSHRTGSPIIVATTRREKGSYVIHYSDPIWPDKSAPFEIEVPRLMQSALRLFEKSIEQRPGEWLWSHNRWKQQTPEKIKRPFRQESLCILLPEEKAAFDAVNEHLSTFREIYPLEFITCKVPQCFAAHCALENADIEPYQDSSELLQTDLRFKLVFNFTSLKKLKTSYKSAFAILDTPMLRRLAKRDSDLSTLLKEVLLRAL
jgi:KDO2-lipid IV(A) lauroyltransferase